MAQMMAKQELEELYRRAIADPRSISRAEHNAIWGYPPPEEEDQLCVAKTGHTLAGLAAKAIAKPDELTLCEAKILCSGLSVNYEMAEPDTGSSGLERIDMLLSQVLKGMEPTPLEKLRNEALDRLGTIRSAEEITALTNALRRCNALEAVEMDAMEEKWRESERARRLKIGTPWMRRMHQAGLLGDGAECWGFAVFRTGCYLGEDGEAAWQRFRDHLLKVAEASVLHWNSGPELQPSLCVFFVEDKELENASIEQLRTKFKQMRDGAAGTGHLPRGIRTNCFLVADEPAIKSEAAQTPYTPRYTDGLEMSLEFLEEDPVVYIRAVDPDYMVATPAQQMPEDNAEEVLVDAATRTTSSNSSVITKERGGEMGDFSGEATVALPRVFDWLHCTCFFAERGITPTSGSRTGWHRIHVETKKPEAWIRNWSPSSGGVSYSWEQKRSL